MPTQLKSDRHRILILTDGLPAGGTERQIVELLKGLRDYYDIQTVLGILVKNGAREEEAKSYADVILPIRQKRSLDATMAISLIGMIRKYKIDLIHSFGSISDFSGIVAGKFTHTPIINGSIRSARPRLNSRDRVSKVCMRFADRVVANSEAGLKAFGCNNWKSAHVIHNGVDLSRFAEICPEKRQTRSVCMVGNFTKKKDQVSLINSLPQVHRNFPSLRLILVGRGERIAQCQDVVKRNQLSDYVSFITDCNNPENIVDTCAIGILLSPGGEGISNVILEYMAMGLPVVATDLGGNREVVEHGVTGLLIPTHETEVISGAICDLLGSPERSVEMGKKGKILVNSKFGMQRMIKEYRDLYLDLLGFV